jgi:NAD(P)-dependent dehydrogenase (short-subunit alcohol dehydrogenase family)
MDPDAVKRIGAAINDKIGRLDILVNNAGININDRHWDKLTPENAKLMIDGNLAAAQCVTVALPLMRAQQDGLIIHTASSGSSPRPRAWRRYKAVPENRR